MTEFTLLAVSPPPLLQKQPDSNMIWIKFPSGGRSFPPVIQDLVEVSVNAIHDVWAGFDTNTYINQITPAENSTIVQFKPEVITDLVTIPQSEYISTNLNFVAPANSDVFATYYAYTESNTGAVNMEIPQENIMIPAMPQKWHRSRRIPQPDMVVHHYHHFVD